ncbi:MAG: DUF6029 family protein [Saprospiraceae bacterium]
MIRAIFTLSLSFFISSMALYAQEQTSENQGRLSGSVDATGNFFIRDTAIGAFNIPQYDYQKFGAQSWFNLNYSNYGFDMGIRFDLFNNSNLLVPTQSYTAQGIGNWYIKKNVNKFNFAAGYIYDQIGSGIIFRAFEERPLAIDNALYGVRVGYQPVKDINIKAFSGKQKQQFDSYGSVIKGISVDGFFSLGDSLKPWTFSPGFGVVGRTFDKPSIDQMVSSISTYTVADSLVPQYNTYAFSAFNTLNAGPFTWYIEGAYKSTDVFFNPFAERTLSTGDIAFGKLQNKPGNVVYSSLSYAAKGIGISVEGKRTENFTFRTNPFVALNRGTINFLPPMSRQNTYRLSARYNAATQELGEEAFQVEMRYKPIKKLEILANFSNIQTLEKVKLYREVLAEFTYKEKHYSAILGFQHQEYNQEIYEVKPLVPIVQTITVYTDFLYKFSKKRSIRAELQHMLTKQDYGSWWYGLVELSAAPHWVLTVADMYNYHPKKTAKALHYPTVSLAYTYHSTRLTLSYVKQVEGVVCTGGICRLEPAFSGVRMTVNSTF